ncbi:MAG TPA: hypothetical protein VET26_11745 [Candidatus Sulfotelmatobacter sp.]|nr:hypothetical protein [Candidatus Sulfotelmatobacter sp.]
MGRFSDDGMWWWDGDTWVATAQIVLPQFPPTEFEQSGKVERARRDMRKSEWLSWANSCALEPITAITGIALLSVLQPALRDYRSWRLEQLALATAYLLGPTEPMLAGEPASTTVDEARVGLARARGSYLAIAVTSTHLIVFRIDSPDGQPRWVALARRPSDVQVELVTVARGLLYSALIVTVGPERWEIRGLPGVFKPQPVVDAWRRAVNAAATG